MIYTMHCEYLLAVSLLVSVVSLHHHQIFNNTNSNSHPSKIIIHHQTSLTAAGLPVRQNGPVEPLVNTLAYHIPRGTLVHFFLRGGRFEHPIEFEGFVFGCHSNRVAVGIIVIIVVMVVVVGGGLGLQAGGGAFLQFLGREGADARHHSDVVGGRHVSIVNSGSGAGSGTEGGG